MADNETRIKLTAVDGVTATLTSIQRATGDLTGGFTRLQGAFAALGATAALGGLAAAVKSAIDTADAMEELGQKTGIAVEQLSALDFAMRREGVSTEAFAKGMKELSKSMVEAGDASSRTGQLFKVLGVDATTGPRQALLQLADAFARMPDGATKATIATELLGKAGTDMIPALNQGAEGIKQLEEQARRLGVTFGAETAAKAAAFKDNIFALQESAKSLGFTLAELVLPSLAEISQQMLIAAQSGGVLKAVLEGLRAAWSEMFLGDAVKNRIGEINQEIVKLEQLVSDGPGILERITGLDQSDALKARIRELRGELAGLVSFQGANAAPAATGGPPSASSAAAKELEARLRALFAAGKEATKATKELGLASEHVTAYLKNQAEEEKKLIALMEHRTRIMREVQQDQVDEINARDAVLDALADGNAQLRLEIETLGMSTLERERYLLKLERERDLKAALDDADRERIGAYYREREALLELRDAREEQASVFNELADRGASFFADLAVSGRDAFKNLERSLKDFARELIAVFAKRWILSVAANLTGNTALSSIGGQVGQGSLAGSLGNLGTIGSLFSTAGGVLASGLNTLGLGGASQFVGGLTGAIAGPALPGSALAAGSGLGGMLAAAGPYLGAAAAVYALYQAFNDGPENWQGRLGFGAQANAYTTDGVFGREGFAYIEGTDSVNRSIQQFMASTGALDRSLASGLTEEQIARITQSIAAGTGEGSRRSDGQSAEFAFEADDSTAAGQLTLEYLKKKYGPVFDEIDGQFADFIRGYTGKAEDLLQAIGTFAGVLAGLDAIGIAGLDIEALRAMQREGEELTTTFERVAGSVATYRQLFTTEAEALGLAQASIAEGFAALGIAIPTSKEEFKRLVDSLDLTTEAGRTLFAGLMELAPAFAAVSDAAARTLSDFDSIMARLRPGYSGQLAQQGLESSTRRFIDLNPWAAGMDWRYVAGQIATITREDFQNYDSESQRLINEILGFTADLAGAAGAAQDFGRSVDRTTSSINDAREAARRHAESLRDARQGIKEWLAGLSLSNLSPLTPSQRLDFANSAYVENLLKAKAGDIGALTNFSSFADAYLREARDFFASGDQYQRIFEAVTGQAAGLAGLSDARPYTAADSHKSTAAIVQAIRDLEAKVGLLDRNNQMAVSRQTGALAPPLGV